MIYAHLHCLSSASRAESLVLRGSAACALQHWIGKSWWFCGFSKRIIQNIVSPADKNSGVDRKKANLLRLQDFVSQTAVRLLPQQRRLCLRCCCEQLERRRVVESCRSFHKRCCFPRGERGCCKTDVAIKKTDCGKETPISSVNIHLTRLAPFAAALPSTLPFYLPIFHLSRPVSTTKPQVQLCFCWKSGWILPWCACAHVLWKLNSCSNTVFLFNLHGNAALSSSCPTLFFFFPFL